MQRGQAEAWRSGWNAALPGGKDFCQAGAWRSGWNAALPGGKDFCQAEAWRSSGQEDADDEERVSEQSLFAIYPPPALG